MKAKWPLTIGGLLVVLIALVWLRFSRPARTGSAIPVSIRFFGYTNQSGASMAVFQVTNHTATVFSCFVGPRVSEANPLVHDLTAAASPGLMPSHGSFTFAVAASPDSNQWRVSVDVRPFREGLPPKLASLLRRFHDKEYRLTSPAFSGPVPRS